MASNESEQRVVRSEHITKPTDVLVIGGGLAGLTAAITAAQRGAKVTLADAGSLGGRARSRQRSTSLGSAMLNEGPHALYDAGAAPAILTKLGIRFGGGNPAISRAKIHWDGHNCTLPAGPVSLATSKILGMRSKGQAAALFANPQRVAASASNSPAGTLAEWFDEHHTTPELQRLLRVLIRLASYDPDPDALPAGTALNQLALSAQGVTYLDGGWQSLVDQLDNLAEQEGVTTLTHTSVASLTRDETGWRAEMKGEGAASMSAAHVVIATGTPKAASGLLPHDLASRLPQEVPLVKAACLDLVTTETAIAPLLLSADDNMYLSEHSPTADLAPDGTKLYCVLRYLDPDESITAEEARSSLEHHARRAGLDPSKAIDSRYLHSMTVAGATHRTNARRVDGDELSSEGIELAGDWVGPHFLADAAMSSGAHAGERSRVCRG